MTLLPRTVAVHVLPLLALGALPLLAVAQAPAGGGGTPVYRCGPGQYSSEPCPGGVKLDTPAPPTADQQRLAREAAAREAQLARQLADERRKRETAAQPAAGNLAPKAAAPAAEAGAKKAAKPRKDKRPGPSARKARDQDQPAAKPRAKGQGKARKSA